MANIDHTPFERHEEDRRIAYAFREHMDLYPRCDHPFCTNVRNEEFERLMIHAENCQNGDNCAICAMYNFLAYVGDVPNWGGANFDALYPEILQVIDENERVDCESSDDESDSDDEEEALDLTVGTNAESNKNAQESSTESTKGTSNESSKGASTESTKAASTESTKGTSTESTKAASTESTKGASTESTKAASTEFTKGASTEYTEETSTDSQPLNLVTRPSS